MIARRHALDDMTLQKRERLRQHGAAVTFLDAQAAKGVLAQGASLAEVGDHVGLRALEDVEREERARREQLDDVAVGLDGEADARRPKGTLLHPARQQTRG